MPSPFSIYAYGAAQHGHWRTGEEPAAAAFVGMTLLLVVAIILQSFRMFKRREGLYYWAITIGAYGIISDSIGIILKYLTSGTDNIWILYTLCMTTGWATYAVAQLIVLWSRLHLITENIRLRHATLLMIYVVSPILVIGNWIVIWPSWNTWDKHMSAKWSPYGAILERICQPGFTIMEVIISAIYIHALKKILRIRSNVRQRRVMLDLIYVLILGVLFDALNTILVWFNMVALSHPIQIFTYALKLRLEFAVLNQLMTVAAQGARRRKQSFTDIRYLDSTASQGIPTYNPGLHIPEMKSIEEPYDRNKKRESQIGIAVPSSAIESTPSAAAVGDRRQGSWLQGMHSRSEENSPPQLYQESSLDRILPKPAHNLKNTTLWRNDEDEEGEVDYRIVLEHWENRGKNAKPIPWFPQA